MIPMSGSGWLDELPEVMTEAEYRTLPEEISRTVEVVFGRVGVPAGRGAPYGART
jgi:hypothetical protein